MHDELNVAGPAYNSGGAHEMEVLRESMEGVPLDVALLTAVSGIQGEDAVKTDVSNDTNICNERHYTPQELAETLNVSVDTIIRWFSREPGVLAIGNDERMHTRKKKLLRIPQCIGALS